MAARTRRGAMVLAAAVLLVASACEPGRRVADDAPPTYRAYSGTGIFVGRVIANPTSPQPFRCRVNQAATKDVGQCGPAHYQGRGFAVGLPGECIDWLKAHWVAGVGADPATDASVTVSDPATGRVLATQSGLNALAWRLLKPTGEFGATMWPDHAYFTVSGVGRLTGGSTVLGWTYDPPRVPALKKYSVAVTCTTGVTAYGGHIRTTTYGTVTGA